jgi:hypothetical protein
MRRLGHRPEEAGLGQESVIKSMALLEPLPVRLGRTDDPFHCNLG